MLEEADIRRRIEECLNEPKMVKDLAYLTEVVYYKIQDSDSLEQKLDWLDLRIKLFEKAYVLSEVKGRLVDALFAPAQVIREYGHHSDIALLNINELVKKVLSSISHLNYEEIKSIGSSWQTLDNSQLSELAFLRNCIARLDSLRNLFSFLESDLKQEAEKWLELKGKILR